MIYSSGVFEIAEASGVQQGTKIVLHLKDDCKEFSHEDRVKGKNGVAYVCLVLLVCHIVTL